MLVAIENKMELNENDEIKRIQENPVSYLVILL